MAGQKVLNGSIFEKDNNQYEIVLTKESSSTIVNLNIHLNICSALIILTVTTSFVFRLICLHDDCNSTSDLFGDVKFSRSCENNSYTGNLVFTDENSLKVDGDAVITFSILNTTDLYLPNLNVSNNLICSDFKQMLQNFKSKESSVIAFHQCNT